MKITAVRALALSAPFAKVFGGLDKVPPHVLRPAANQVTVPRLGQASTIVCVETGDGLRGYGEALGLPHPEVTALIVARQLGDLLLGHSPLDTGVLWERMQDALRGARSGPALNACAALDMALWDLKGKALGLPVHRLIGGALRDRIPVYASPVPFMADPESSAREAAAFVEGGYRALKLKIGRGVETDVAHVAAVREAIGPGVGLHLDANCAYDVRRSLALARRIEPYDPAWLEEPVPPQDVAGLAEIARRVDVRIATGENEQTAYAFRDLLAARAADVLMPNIAKTGLTECLRIGALARAFNARVAPHGVGSGLAIAAALQWCAAEPAFLTYEHNQLVNPLREAVLAEPLELREGALLVPQGPGLGVTVDERAVEEYVVGRF